MHEYVIKLCKYSSAVFKMFTVYAKGAETTISSTVQACGQQDQFRNGNKVSHEATKLGWRQTLKDGAKMGIISVLCSS